MFISAFPNEIAGLHKTLETTEKIFQPHVVYIK